MELQYFDFSQKSIMRKRCIMFDGKGQNRVMCKYKPVYQMEEISACPDLKGFYLSVDQLENGFMYSCWTECGENLVLLRRFYEHHTLPDMISFLQGKLAYRGTQGFLSMLSQFEKMGKFVDKTYITALRMAGEEKLADHYAEYREEIFARQEEEERAKKEALDCEEAERALREEQEQEAQMREAERAIRNHEWVRNNRCGGETVILRLFDKHGISLPGRTKGAMRKRLGGICYKKDLTVSVIWEKTRHDRYCPDSVFDYVKALCEKICA